MDNKKIRGTKRNRVATEESIVTTKKTKKKKVTSDNEEASDAPPEPTETPPKLTETPPNPIVMATDKDGQSSHTIGDDPQHSTNEEKEMEELIRLFLRRRKRKMKKKKKRMRRKRLRQEVELDGERVRGLDKMAVYNPGSEDEDDDTMDRQNNMVLRKLFKKSGVDTAMEHDTIINSSHPDYAVVEAEANRVAKSAARALKDSRQRCVGMGGHSTWGQPTWTGVHGTLGAPKRRFGESVKELVKNLEPHSKDSSSFHVSSSSMLLTKMRKRNAHSIPNDTSTSCGRGIHSSDNANLLTRIRDFVAIGSKKNGQATTDEILKKFAADLPPGDSAMFRSMLHEICDFHRYHGDGVWTLKSEYR